MYHEMILICQAMISLHHPMHHYGACTPKKSAKNRSLPRYVERAHKMPASASPRPRGGHGGGIRPPFTARLHARRCWPESVGHFAFLTLPALEQAAIQCEPVEPRVSTQPRCKAPQHQCRTSAVPYGRESKSSCSSSTARRVHPSMHTRTAATLAEPPRSLPRQRHP